MNFHTVTSAKGRVYTRMDFCTVRDVMVLAGHSSFATTHRFYLAVADDLVDRARVVSEKSLNPDLLRSCCAPPKCPSNEKGPTSVNPCQP